MQKISMITGCNSLLGIAIAEKALAAGYGVMAHYNRRRERIDGLIAAFGMERVEAVQADIETEDGAKKLVHAAQRAGERLKLLVNNAATVGGEAPIAELAWGQLARTFGVNLFSPVIVSAAAFEEMRKSGGGKIINISSVGVKYGGGEMTLHYGASKAALEAMTINLSRQGAKFGILVNAVRPGIIDTEFHAKNTPGKDMAKRVAMVPLKRMAAPGEIAAMVGFLASPDGDYITGEIITIAGGD